MLELKNIRLDVGDETYLHDINLQMTPGRFNLLLGATLSGKTSLMRVIAGLESPSGGGVYLHGRNITTTSVQKRRVAMVYQQFINYPTMTVFENIASPLVSAGATATEIETRVKATAQLLKLTPFLSRRPAALSGGQQQRVALARALVKDADIILLDEPLANLDYKLREELREELPRLFAKRDAVVVYATSDPAEALLLGGHVAALHEGKIAQSGEVGKVYRAPDNLAAAAIFSDPPLNTAPFAKRDKRLHFTANDGEAPLPPSPRWQALDDGDYHLAFRAHHLLDEAPASGALCFEGVVQIAEIAGSESFVHLRVNGCHNWVMQTTKIKEWKIGDTIACYLSPRRLMVFDGGRRRLKTEEDGDD